MHRFGVAMITKWLGNWVESTFLLKGWECVKRIQNKAGFQEETEHPNRSLGVVQLVIFLADCAMVNHPLNHRLGEFLFSFSEHLEANPASKVRFSQHPPISIPLEVPK